MSSFLISSRRPAFSFLFLPLLIDAFTRDDVRKEEEKGGGRGEKNGGKEGGGKKFTK